MRRLPAAVTTRTAIDGSPRSCAPDSLSTENGAWPRDAGLIQDAMPSAPEGANVTSLVAWVAADTRGPSSLNIATDSRITWSSDQPASYGWDYAQKVFASTKVPLLVGFVGDVLFPALVVPGIISRIDRGVFRSDGSIAEGVVEALRRAWREYPPAERRPLNIYLAHRIGDGVSAHFTLTAVSYKPDGAKKWTIQHIPVPSASQVLVVDGSGRIAVRAALDAWQKTAAAETSRAIYSGFGDGVVSGVDPNSGGTPQLGCIYRIGAGRLLGIIHKNRRYFAGSQLNRR